MPSVSMPVPEKERQMTQAGITTLVVINKRGKVVDSIGEANLGLSKEKKEILFMQTALQCSMQDEQNNDFGKMEFFLTKRDKSKFVCKQLGDDRIAIAIATDRTDDATILEYIDNLRKMQERTISGNKI
ncbi:MAG: hypothetical protein QXY22_01005 [Candidatus Nitrosotenuis sp.]